MLTVTLQLDLEEEEGATPAASPSGSGPAGRARYAPASSHAESAVESAVESALEPAASEASSAAEWGMRRHAAIATAAGERLQSQNAIDAIARIFDESGEVSLGEAARWADRLKTSDRPRDPATERFLGDGRNRRHNRWHYVNLPLGIDGYDRQRYPEFTRRDDIVQTILLCVESLRRPGPQARFEEITALRWLTHLIGDLHQPIHIGCGYIADAASGQPRLVFTAAEAHGLDSDRGGGALLLPAPTGGNLHGFWDSSLGPDVVPEALEAADDTALVRELIAAPAPAAFGEDADIEGRVTAWANESLEAARAAYEGISITSAHPSGDYRVSWEGESSYRRRCARIVSARMSAAAANLADLLDTIWP